jgi:twitching motility protein PilT
MPCCAPWSPRGRRISISPADSDPRWRIDGEIREIASAPVLGEDSVLTMLGDAMPERNRREFDATNDTDFAHEIQGLSRFRVNVFRDAGGVGAVFRQIPATILTFDQLGLPEVVARFCAEPKGLVLVTGPTGSGKSTTLAAMVDAINRKRAEHIITLEDPIEFVHPSRKALVNQREVGPHTDSFARALRAALREDPDIVLVGEMRDLETIALALETANTGHLVFGTLHTATAITTVDRIVGLFPADQQNQIRSVLADVLKGVISQTLLRRAGGGRVAALEVLVVNQAVANLVREGKTHQIASQMQTSKALGNQMLNDALASLCGRARWSTRKPISRRWTRTISSGD